MNVTFFDDPVEQPKPPKEVRIRQLGLFVHEDGRRVAIGFDITPFQERPCIEVRVTNEDGEPAGTMTIVDTLDANFTVTFHLRDKRPRERYEVSARLYYATPETEPTTVHEVRAEFDASRPGDQTKPAKG